MSVPERHSYEAPRRRSKSRLELALERLQESVAGIRQGIEIRPDGPTRRIVAEIEEAQRAMKR